LEKDHRRRYVSAEALAADLHRFLVNEPIQARPVRFWERGVKWARRRPAIAALIAVSAVALLSSLAGALLYLELRARDLQVAARDLQVTLQRERSNGQRRDEVRQLVSVDAREAVGNKEWDGARLYLARALAKIGPDEPFLEDLREQASALQGA